MKLIMGLSLSLALTGVASAQLDSMSPADVSKTKEMKEGWTKKATVNLGGNFNHNDNVPGKKDGQSVTGSLGAIYGADYREGNHEVRTKLSLFESITRSPSFDEFVLTTDELRGDALYLFNIDSLPWLSPYANVNLLTNVFEGYYYSDTPGVPKEKLTDGFGIIRLQATVGGLFKIYQSKPISLEGRVGFGTRQIFADGSRAAVETALGTGFVDLQDTSMFGIETGLDAKGDIVEDKISYTAYARAFTPVSSDPEDPQDRDILSLTTREFGANVSFKLVEWASIVYEWRSLTEPLLLPGPQVSQNVLLSTSWTLGKGLAKQQ
jgi:hypothetical protein